MITHPTDPKDLNKLKGFDTPQALEMNSANEHSMGLNIAMKIMFMNINNRIIEKLHQQKYLINENANQEYIDLLIKELSDKKICSQLAETIIKEIAKDGNITMIKNEIVDELTDEGVSGLLEGFNQRTKELKKAANVR